MKTGLALLGFVFVSCTASSQQAPAKLSLEEAFRQALKHHPAASAAEHIAGAAAERIRQAEAGWMPSFTFQASATNGPLGAPAMGLQGLAGDPVKKHYGSSLNLYQPIYDFGKTQHLVAARKSFFHATEQDASTLDAWILLNVHQAYINVLRRQQLAGVYRDNVRQREATTGQAKLLSESGLKADVDYQLAKANLADAQGALIAAENDVSAAYADLNNAMGETKLTTYQLDAAAPPAPSTPSSFDDQARRALAQRPELKSAAFQLDAADQTIRSARSELLPQFSGVASAGAITPSKVITNNMPYAVGVAVTFPLYTGGSVEGRIAEEKQKREVVAAIQSQTREAVKLQVARALLDVQTRDAQVKAAREQVAAAASSLQQASERYRLQLSSIVELISAEAAATKASASLVNAENDLAQSNANLDWATGTTYRNYTSPKRK